MVITWKYCSLRNSGISISRPFLALGPVWCLRPASRRALIFSLMPAMPRADRKSFSCSRVSFFGLAEAAHAPATRQSSKTAFVNMLVGVLLHLPATFRAWSESSESTVLKRVKTTLLWSFYGQCLTRPWLGWSDHLLNFCWRSLLLVNVVF